MSEPAPDATPNVLLGAFKRLPVWARIGIPVLVVLLIVLAIVAVLPKASKFENAVKSCDVTSNGHASLGDSGRTLVMDGKGESSGGLTVDQEACVLAGLHVSDAILSEMDSTRALDGQVKGSWDDIDAIWTYHPDDGLDMILTLK